MVSRLEKERRREHRRTVGQFGIWACATGMALGFLLTGGLSIKAVLFVVGGVLSSVLTWARWCDALDEFDRRSDIVEGIDNE